MQAQEDLLKQVRESIEKALPAIQVDVFRQYIDGAEKAKKELEALMAQYASLLKESRADKEELRDLRTLQLKSEEIARERQALELEKLKFNIEKQLKDAEVNSGKEKIGLIQGLVHDIFRNIETRRHIMGDVPVINRDSAGVQ